jgi:hypothetical protein
MKNLRITLFLLMLLAAGSTYSQLIYIGTPAQKLSSASNPLIKLKQDTLFVPTTNGLFKKAAQSAGTTWIPAGFQGLKINDFVLIGQDTIVCVADSTEGNTIFTSVNNGNSYVNTTNGFGSTGIDFQPGARIDVNPNNHQELIAMSGSCVARSTDFSGSWTPIYLDWGYTVYQPSVLRYNPLNPDYIYSGGELSLFDSYLAYSLDSGANWGTSSVETNQAVNGIAFHPTDTDTVFIGKEGSIQRSADKGVSWTNVFNTPSYEYIYSIVYDPNNPHILYAAGAINGLNETVRIFRSTDGGSNWSAWYQETFPGSDKQVISMIMQNTTLYLLTRDHSSNLTGVYKLNATTASLPDISQNETLVIFPNPFTDETTIKSGKPFINAELTITNSLGQTVKQIRNISGSTHIISRGNLPQGVYVVRLTEAGESFTQKMVVRD